MRRGWARLGEGAANLAPGIGASLAVAAASSAVAWLTSAPVMLLALLLGMALGFLSKGKRWSPGIDFTGRRLLRIGVALLGIRISIGAVVALGWPTLLLVLAAVTLTILAAVLAARPMGFNPLFGLLSGGATAICGASAAMALSAALPSHPLKEQATLFTIVGVSALSTVAMIAYPPAALALGLDASRAGLLMGATIHDVAQVVGAGYAISPEAGDTATLVKLIRVALLAPVIVAAGLAVRAQMPAGGRRPPLLPWFVVVFVLLVLVNSSGVLPAAISAAGNQASRLCLVAAVAAIGMKTRFKDMAQAGWKPALLMVLETLFLAALVLAVILGDVL